MDLKDYEEKINFDDWYEVVDYDPRFNPNVWLPRNYKSTEIESKVLEALRQKPDITLDELMSVTPEFAKRLKC